LFILLPPFPYFLSFKTEVVQNALTVAPILLHLDPEVEKDLRAEKHLDVLSRLCADLAQKTEDDMMKVRNLGRKSLDEVKKKLEELGLSLRQENE